MLGDGNVFDGVARYSSSSKELTDDFQRLCLHCGYSGNITVNHEKGSTWTICGKTGVTNADNLIVRVINSYNNTPIVNDKRNKNVLEKWIDYDGKVYCCESTTGVIYVRRNGVPIWSGNSRHGQKGDVKASRPCQITQ